MTAARAAPRTIPLAAALAVVALATGCRRPPPRPQNLIVVVIDTLRADHLSTYGYARSTSPHLDAFGRENVVFEQVRSGSACTYPSVNSLLTSRSGFAFLGQPDGAMGLPAAIPGLAEILRARGFSTGAVSASAVVRRSPSMFNAHGGYDRGFDVFDEACELRRAECVNERARRFLNRATAPFFLYLHYLDPHANYEPLPPFRSRFGPVDHGPAWARLGDASPLFQTIHGPRHFRATPEVLQVLTDLYDGEIAYLDDRLGALFDDLRARGLLENTIVAVTADHGEEFLDHGDVWHCQNAYDSTVRVPFYLHVPGLERARRVAAGLSSLDIVPTLLDYLGVPAPAGFEGRSARDVLESPAPVGHIAFSIQNQWRAASDGRFKLLLDVPSGELRLFDVQHDPAERNDVKLEHRADFNRLRQELEAWLLRIEGTRDGRSSLPTTDEARRQLEAVGYLH